MYIFIAHVGADRPFRRASEMGMVGFIIIIIIQDRKRLARKGCSIIIEDIFDTLCYRQLLIYY
jgi:hypothetical protein